MDQKTSFGKEKKEQKDVERVSVSSFISGFQLV